jgi:isoamylase
VKPAELIKCLAGCADRFQPNGRKPYHGINDIVCHDGFTLRDLYSDNGPQNNQPFPLGPSKGGTSDNFSWDQGGDRALQRQAARNGMALTLVAIGVPMLLGGDEMYRTQYGNNNPFNLDNAKFWINPQDAKEHTGHSAYAKTLLKFRREHPALRRSEFFDGRDHNGNGLEDVTWLTDVDREADAGYLDNEDNCFIAMRLDGTEVAGEPAASIYVAYNGWKKDINATLPDNLPRTNWQKVFDTSAEFESANNFWDPPTVVGGGRYKVAAKSVVILAERPQ